MAFYNWASSKNHREGVTSASGLVILSVVLNFHVLRNLTSTYYLAVPAAYLFVLATYIWSVMFRGKQHRGLPRSGFTMGVVVYIGFSCSATVLTLFQNGLSSTAYAVGRFMFCMPIAVLVLYFRPDQRTIRKLLAIIVLMATLGMLTVAYQYVFGAITWFAEPGERAQLFRYASILGSIPTLGGVVPCALIVLLVLRFSGRSAFLGYCGVVLGAILALSKQAIAGSLLAILLVATLNWAGSKRAIVIAFVTIVIVMVGAGALMLGGVVDDASTFSRGAAYAGAIFENSDSSASKELGGDVTLLQSLEDRVTELPATSLRLLAASQGVLPVYIGGGFGMLGPALMPSDDDSYHTAHNQYVDMLLIGGIGMAAVYVYLLLSTFRALWRWRSVPEIRALAILTVYFGIASLFSTGLTFQPAMGTVFWLAIGTAWMLDGRDCRMNGSILAGEAPTVSLQGIECAF